MACLAVYLDHLEMPSPESKLTVGNVAHYIAFRFDSEGMGAEIHVRVALGSRTEGASARTFDADLNPLIPRHAVLHANVRHSFTTRFRPSAHFSKFIQLRNIAHLQSIFQRCHP